MESRKDTLKQRYNLRFSNIEESRDNVWKVLCSDFFQKLIPRDSCLLDLGAGWGEFINNIEAGRKLAMDLNPETGIRLVDDIDFLNQDCSKPWELKDESLDVVFTSNFLEHLPHKKSIERTFTEANRCLKENGKIICLGPNVKYLSGSYWDFWDHIIPLTERSLIELLKMKGFEIERYVPRFLPYSMSTGRTPPTVLVRAYLKLPLAWPFLGKQFLVVGRKNRSINPTESMEATKSYSID